jgi:iron(III) transport system substrate-binding protein
MLVAGPALDVTGRLSGLSQQMRRSWEIAATTRAERPMTGLTRRELIIGTASIPAAAILPAGSAASQELSAQEREVYEAAKSEGQITWYSGQYDAETSEAVGRAFGERYPGVRCNVVRSTSQVAFQRLSQDLRANVAQCDVLSTTNSGHLTFLKRAGNLTQYRPSTADGLLEPLRDIDPDNYFHVTFAGLFMLAHNTRLVSEAEAPNSWKELTDPRWKDKLAVGHPGFSGAIGVWAVQMRKMYGWDFFKALERNKPQIGRSSQDPVTAMNAGERPVGVCVPLGTTATSISRGNPLRLVYPTEGVLATLSPSAIISNAPHPNAAKLFMEFQLGPGLSMAVRPLFNPPLRGDVPPPEGVRPLTEVKLIAPSLEEQEKEIPEVRELWRDTFGV